MRRTAIGLFIVGMCTFTINSVALERGKPNPALQDVSRDWIDTSLTVMEYLASLGGPHPEANGSHIGAGSNSSQMIKSKCAADWPDDFHMQATCVDMQKDALNKLASGRPSDISQDQYKTVHTKCEHDWPQDFHMRETCETMQFDAIRKLQKE